MNIDFRVRSCLRVFLSQDKNNCDISFGIIELDVDELIEIHLAG